MPSPVPPFAVQFDEGLKLKTPTAGDVIVRADTAQTNASLTVLEFLVPPNDGPAVHAHLREDELWYVIEGDFRFKAGDEMFHVSTGGMAFGPRRLAHAFQNVGTELGRRSGCPVRVRAPCRLDVHDRPDSLLMHERLPSLAVFPPRVPQNAGSGWWVLANGARRLGTQS